MSVTPDFRFDKDDQLSPVRIIHKSEQVWIGGNLEQNYNYLDYEFETAQHRYRARAYLDNIDEVTIHGPFDKNSLGVIPLDGQDVDQRVLDYLGRRYPSVKRFDRCALQGSE